MQRVSLVMVRNAFARYVRACEAWGYDVTGWTMSEGSNGEAWRVSGYGPGIDSYGIVGYSRREVFETLSTASRVLETLPIGGVR